MREINSAKERAGMEAVQLYRRLEEDFIPPNIGEEEWDMRSVADFLSENFKRRRMGLVCDFTPIITKVYPAVFPSEKVMRAVLDDGAQEAMLFVHHPAVWDIRRAPNVFQPMNRDLLGQFRDRRISIYCLHVPLDNFGEYSTSVTLARALGIEPKDPFGPYLGAMCGVFGETKLATVNDLREIFQNAVGHRVSLYNYGDIKIKNGIVAIVAGGGNDIDILQEITRAGVNTFVTGITVKNDHSQEAHNFAEKHGINILGGTHYSTEQFACRAMVDYFKALGLPSIFIEDAPVMEDL